ncbi:hypothetical protein ACFW9L_16505 [Streptomyces sp. NPDC059517]|uniref:hypothetical protein n=1 Tax=Streptomyces sp. NPDC059517 TaxID=3346855 RepID=UPI003689FAD1
MSLEPYIMETTANVVHRAGHTPPGRPWRNRRIANDTRGHLAALMLTTPSCTNRTGTGDRFSA